MILRGALDGLSAVAPIGDPDYAALHGELALQWGGDHPALALNSFFGLNPAMPNFARLYGARQAIAVHACATNYRERSHFDGQDVLESGMLGSRPGAKRLAQPSDRRACRRASASPSAAALLSARRRRSCCVGRRPVLGWAPSGLVAPTDDLTARLMNLYAHRDPALAAALQAGVDADRMATKQGMDALKPGGDIAQGMRKTAEGAARLMSADDGPRIAAMAFDGWDTHANEGGATGRLAQLLGGLDGAIAAFETELGPRWKDTAIVAVTEFGRTVHINGTTGTDHGTATVAFLAGGALKGGPRHRRLARPRRGRSLRKPRPQADDRSARRAERPAGGSVRPVGGRARTDSVPRYDRREADERVDRRVSAGSPATFRPASE